MEQEFSRLRALAAVVATLPLLIGGGLLAAARTRLPDPVATHFGPDGVADDSTGRNLFVWAVLNLLVLLAVAIGVAAWRVRGRRLALGWIGPLAFTSGIFGGLAGWTALTQSGLASWRQAESGWLGLTLALVVAVGTTLATTTLLRRLPEEPSKDPAELPRLDLSPGQRAAWVGRSSWAGGPWLAAAFAVLAVATGVLGPVWLAFVPAMFAVLALVFTSLRASVDARGLGVAWGPWGLPRVRIPITQIRSASAGTVRPGEWGGWGYRGSVRLLGRAAAVVRGGPGLVLDLGDGRSFAVTVDEPDTGAALLNALVQRDPAAPR